MMYDEWVSDFKMQMGMSMAIQSPYAQAKVVNVSDSMPRKSVVVKFRRKHGRNRGRKIRKTITRWIP